jgi:hypothetical protein
MTDGSNCVIQIISYYSNSEIQRMVYGSNSEIQIMTYGSSSEIQIMTYGCNSHIMLLSVSQNYCHIMSLSVSQNYCHRSLYVFLELLSIQCAIQMRIKFHFVSCYMVAILRYR